MEDRTTRTQQQRLLWKAGLRSPVVLDALRNHNLAHLKWVIAHNKGKPALIASKIFNGDWSTYDPIPRAGPKIFSVMNPCPICGEELSDCHGIHGFIIGEQED